MRIDVHTHFQCLDFIKHLQGRPEVAAEMIEQLTCPSFERELIYHGNIERLFSLPE